MSVFMFLMLRIAISLHCHYSELSKQILNPLENWESTLSKEPAECRRSELARQLAHGKLKYKALPSLWSKSFYKCPSKTTRSALKEVAGACVQQSVWWRRGRRAFPWNSAKATSSGTIAMNVSSTQVTCTSVATRGNGCCFRAWKQKPSPCGRRQSSDLREAALLMFLVGAKIARGCLPPLSGNWRQVSCGGLATTKSFTFHLSLLGQRWFPKDRRGTCILWGWRGVPNGGGRADCLGAGEQQSVSRLVKCYPQPRKSGAKVSVNALRNIFESVSQCWKRSGCARSPFSIRNFLHCFPSPKAASLQSYVFEPKPQKPGIWEVWELNALEKFIF